MHFRLERISRVIFLSVIAAAIASPAVLTVNGTDIIGSSGAIDSINFGGSVGPSPFSFNYTVNADTYNLAGTYSASYTSLGTYILFVANATYLGSTPTTTTDVLSVHLLQNYFDSTPGVWDGPYTESIPIKLDNTAGAGSSVSAQLFYDGQGLGLAGPYGPGSYYVKNTANLANLSGDTLSADFDFLFTFTEGTGPGTTASIPASAPEPSQLGVVGLACTAFLGLWARRRRAGNFSENAA